jgi:hypothetical protein
VSSNEKDILGKADGLMRRHAPAADPASVPTLTEMVGPGAPSTPPTLHTDLAREIFARVMAEVETRLAADLEKRLNQHLVPQVHAAVASAIGDLHHELSNAIGDAINRALEHRNLK